MSLFRLQDFCSALTNLTFEEDHFLNWDVLGPAEACNPDEANFT